MSNNSTFKDIINVTVSNIISLTSSILNGFIIPIILGTLNYGYYKIFALYASYTVLCHFGFNDGIISIYGGTKLKDLNKYTFRSNSIFFILFQLLISIFIVSMSFFTNNKFYETLFVLLGINTFVQNLLGYYQNISQTVMRFNEYSIVNIVQYISLIICVLAIWVYCHLYKLSNISFIPYVISIILVNMLLVIWYLYYYRKITFGTHESIFHRFRSFKEYFISGLYMTFGYGVSILIFNLDSQFVIKFFSTRTYGIYAFAYSIFSAGLTILGSAAVVLLPHLKTHSKKYILKKYPHNITYILLLVYLAIIGYFPLKLIIHRFIFEYYNSLIYFRLLLPGMAITCCVSIVISNYYYALKKGKSYFGISLIILIISFLFDCCAYIIFKSPRALALSSTLSLLFWYILSDYFIVKWYGVKWAKNLAYIVFMMILFLLISGIHISVIISGIIYLLIYLSISFLFFREEIFNLIKIL